MNKRKVIRFCPFSGSEFGIVCELRFTLMWTHGWVGGHGCYNVAPLMKSKGLSWLQRLASAVGDVSMASRFPHFQCPRSYFPRRVGR